MLSSLIPYLYARDHLRSNCKIDLLQSLVHLFWYISIFFIVSYCHTNVSLSNPPFKLWSIIIFLHTTTPLPIPWWRNIWVIPNCQGGTLDNSDKMLIGISYQLIAKSYFILVNSQMFSCLIYKCFRIQTNTTCVRLLSWRRDSLYICNSLEIRHVKHALFSAYR